MSIVYELIIVTKSGHLLILIDNERRIIKI